MTQSGLSDQRLKNIEKQVSKLPTVEAPYIEVFKFRPVNKYTLDSLIKKQLYFSSPAELNDPHDCQVDIEQSIRSALGEATGKQRANLELLLRQKDTLASLRSNLDCSGVCSFSNKLLNPVMWSHYADGHRGIGLYYKIPEDFLLAIGCIVLAEFEFEKGEDGDIDGIRIGQPAKSVRNPGVAKRFDLIKLRDGI